MADSPSLAARSISEFHATQCCVRMGSQMMRMESCTVNPIRRVLGLSHVTGTLYCQPQWHEASWVGACEKGRHKCPLGLSQSSLTPSALHCNAMSSNTTASECEKGLQWQAALHLPQGVYQSFLQPNAVYAWVRR